MRGINGQLAECSSFADLRVAPARSIASQHHQLRSRTGGLASTSAPAGQQPSLHYTRSRTQTTTRAHSHRDYDSLGAELSTLDNLSRNPPPAPPLLLFSGRSQGPSTEDLQEILPLLSPKQLADAIWGFAKQGLQPSAELMNMITDEVRSKLQHFKSQDLSNTVWALAVLKHQPEKDWWQQFERQVYMNVTDFTGRELANLMWALAILEHKPALILDSVLGHAVDNFASYSANTLHLIIWSVGKLNYLPSAEWMDKFLRAAQTSFFQFTPSEMSNIIWALAKLGHKLPTMWLDNFLMVAQWRFPSFDSKLLSIVVWSAAMLGHRPSQEWLLCFEEQVREKFEEFSGQELACIAWALRRFGYSKEQNAVFYMLYRQERFLQVDFEILSNPKLLGQVLNYQTDGAAGGKTPPSAA